MGNRILFNKEKNLILLYNNEKQIWEDRTLSIHSLYEAYYYGHFTGYDIHFIGNHKKFFYRKENVNILDFIRNIPIDKQDVFIQGEIIEAKKIDEFEDGYYKITTSVKTFVTENLKLESGKYKDIYTYYDELAQYAGLIAQEDEPLYFLSKNFQRIKPSSESVLNQYLKGIFLKTQDNQTVIVPFDFNQSQYKAIDSALNNTISVIEGPPGTGKTQTILNLISNIVSRNKNCAIVSNNNNTAIDNVYEKLSEEGISFIAATLGRLENVGRFFDNNNEQELDAFLETKLDLVDLTTGSKIKELSTVMKRIHELEINIAQLKNEQNDVLIEKKNHSFRYNSNAIVNENLNSKEYLNLINKLERPKKISIIKKWFINFKFKIKIQDIDLTDLLVKLESIFYKNRTIELTNALAKLDRELSEHEKQAILRKLQKLSKDYLLEQIQSHYKNIYQKSFDKDSYKKDYSNFLKRYPVVLSTSQSLLNNAPNRFLFDYLIIDEASQGDLLSSVIAMSCARRIVVVGDSRQLQQIDEERLFDHSQKLVQKYNIPESYRYESNSILQSVRDSVKDVPTTLLREHYRCAPDIINFCNKMFYDEELIPMTRNIGQHIEVVKTVPGNHARKNPNGTGMYNQREIDELVNLIKDKDNSKIGVITPFRYQARLIQENLKESKLEADTIHKFQGRQKDEIYLSFVVNSLDKNPKQVENRLYDFVTDERLLNVAISRAKTKVTAIVSDKIYHSSNNIIHDFIQYAENLYGNSITRSSTVTSVFDYLYAEYELLLKEKFKGNSKEHRTELLMSELIDEILEKNKKISYSRHVRLSKIINKTDGLSDDERRYIMHPWTHVDFLFYNKISKERLFVLEVDGIQYHEQSHKQSINDKLKDKVLVENGVTIYRFRTNESNEKEKLTDLLRCFIY
jgi:superfamily I DNA and/or RNA helicase